MEALHISEIIEGMVLGMNLNLGEKCLTKGLVLKAEDIDLIKDSGLETLWIDTEANLEEILRKRIHSLKLNRKIYNKGDYICLQGDQSTEFYILLEGELEVILIEDQRLRQCTSRKSREEMIKHYGNSIASISGRLVNFGEMGPLLGQERSATIRAKTRSVIQSIPATGEGFSQTILENPDLGFSVALTISRRFYDTISGIEKYQKILNQTLAIISNVKKIYKDLILAVDEKFKLSGESALNVIKNKLYEKALLTEAQFEEEANIEISPGLKINQQFSDLDLDLLNTLSFEKGAEIPLQSQDSDFIYMLLDGELDIYKDGVLIDNLDQKGDLLGCVRALSFLDLNYRRLGDEPFLVKAKTKSKLICVTSTELMLDPAKYKYLILYICRILAESLKSNHHLQTESLTKINVYFNRYSYAKESYIKELKEIINYFFDNQRYAVLCLNEVLALKKLLQEMESDFVHLKDCIKVSFANPYALPMLKLGVK